MNSREWELCKSVIEHYKAKRYTEAISSASVFFNSKSNIPEELRAQLLNILLSSEFASNMVVELLKQKQITKEEILPFIPSLRSRVNSNTDTPQNKLKLALIYLEIGEYQAASRLCYEMLESSVITFYGKDFCDLLFDSRLIYDNSFKLVHFDILAFYRYYSEPDVLIQALCRTTFFGSYIATEKKSFSFFKDTNYQCAMKKLKDYVNGPLISDCRLITLRAVYQEKLTDKVDDAKVKDYLQRGVGRYLALERLKTFELESKDKTLREKMLLSLKLQGLLNFPDNKLRFEELKVKDNDLELLKDILMLGDVGLDFAMFLIKRGVIKNVDLALIVMSVHQQVPFTNKTLVNVLHAYALFHAGDFESAQEICIKLFDDPKIVEESLFYHMLTSGSFSADDKATVPSTLIFKATHFADRINILLQGLCPNTFVGSLVKNHPQFGMFKAIFEYIENQLESEFRTIYADKKTDAKFYFDQISVVTRSALIENRENITDYVFALPNLQAYYYSILPTVVSKELHIKPKPTGNDDL